MQNTPFSINKTLNVRGRIIALDEPKVMGILNVTPDSFYGASRHSEKSVVTEAEKMLVAGATFIDIGGYSSRPGADDISVDEETSRVIPAIRAVVRSFPDAVISIDTFRATVARQAILEGASMVNDISGGALDPLMFETIGALKVPYVLMHMKGTPQTMSGETQYGNLVNEIMLYFKKRLDDLLSFGVTDVIIDPGFGFAKTIDQNFRLLKHFNTFHAMGKPVLAGLSRKSMIWKTLDIRPEEALNGTTALNSIALLQGASILRVHDVQEAVQVVTLHRRMSQL